MNGFDLIFFGVFYLLMIIIYLLQISISKIILTALKKDILNKKSLTEDKFNDVCGMYKFIYLGSINRNNIVDIDAKYLFIIALIPGFNIIFSDIYQDFVMAIKKRVNNYSDLTILSTNKCNTTVKDNLLKYIYEKTQSKEREIIEKALSNKNNPYFKLISENAKMINDIIVEFERNDYILNRERATNFSKNINNTILSFVQAIELIDDLNFKSDITIINLTKYNNYLSDLKFDLKEQINTK